MRKSWLPGLFLAVVLMGVSACGGEQTDGGDTSEGAAATQQKGETDSPGPQADLEDVPEVVAEVNGEDISRSEFVQAYEIQFRQAATQAQSSGQELDQDQLKKQVAENLVGTELLVQEADRRDITVSDKDVDKTLQGLATQNGAGSVDAFVAAMEQQGMDRDEVERQVRNQVMIERVVADEAGGIRVSDKEVRGLYDQLVAQQEQSGQQAGQEMPPLAKVRPQLEDQVRSQKQAQVAQRLLGDLRKDADIVVNL